MGGGRIDADTRQNVLSLFCQGCVHGQGSIKRKTIAGHRASSYFAQHVHSLEKKGIVLIPPDQELGQLFQTADDALLVRIRGKVLKLFAECSKRQQKSKCELVVVADGAVEDAGWRDICMVWCDVVPRRSLN